MKNDAKQGKEMKKTPYGPKAEKKTDIRIKPGIKSRTDRKEKPYIKSKSSIVKKDTVNKQNEVCPYFRRCGACRYIDIPYEEQLDIKQKYIDKLLGSYVKPERIAGMEQPLYYRNKVHAVFDRDAHNKIIRGIYAEGTHDVVPVEGCMLEDRRADAIIETIKGLLPSFKIKIYDEDTGYGLFRHVLVRTGRAQNNTVGEIMVVLVTASVIFPSKNNFVKALREKHPEITTIVQNINDRRTSVVLGEREQIMFGKGYIEDILCEKTFRLSAKSFYQVNPVQTEKLYSCAKEYAALTGKETVLDAYCGIGTIGIVLADKALKVYGVELNRDAVRDAVSNAKRNNVMNEEFFCADATEFMQKLASAGEQIDVITMDPPRAGSTPEFITAAAAVNAKRIVYISCNPETLAADLKLFTQKGYKVMKIAPYDLFPWTEHVETVVLMSRVQK